MFNKIRHLLAAPVFDNEEKTRKARVLNAILLAILSLSILTIILVVSFVGRDITELKSTWLILFTSFVLLIAIRRGYVQIAGFLAAMILWVGITLALINRGGILNPAFSGYMLAILVAGLTSGWRTTIPLAFLSLAAGVLIPPDGIMLNAREALIPMLLFFMFSAFLLHLENRTVQEAFKRVWNNERKLAQANAELQKEVEERKRIEVILRENEARFRIALESSGTVVFNQDTDLRYTWIQNSVFGEPEELAGKSDSDLFSAGDAAVLTAIKQHCLESGRRQQAILHLNIRGRNAEYNLMVEPLHNIAGEIRGIVGAAYEVTELRLVEQALRESEARYRQLLEAVPVAIAVNNLDGKILYVNPAGVRIYGATRADELIGLSADQFATPESLPIMYQRRQLLREGKIAPLLEYPIRRLDGAIISMDVVAIPLEYEGQAGLMAVLIDASERKLSEEALRESEKRYRRLLEILPITVIVNDFDGNVFYINPTGIEMLGAAGESDVVGHVFDEFGTPESTQIMRERRQRFREGQQLPPAEYSIQRLDGRIIEVEVTAITAFYEGKEVLIAVIRDISERKRMQTTRLNAELMQMELEKEKQLLNLRDSFIRMISHEFRTPLTVILSSKELLENYYERMTSERREEHFEKMGVQIEHMLGMLEDILTISQASAGMLNFNPLRMNLEYICAEFLDEVKITDHNKHAFHLVNDGNCNSVMADPRLLRHILLNLLSNAAKYTPAGRRIWMETACDGDYITLRVRDEGIGIPPNDLDKIFDAFHRASNIGEVRGTGLGLMIVKTAVDIHGGTIECESELNVGTTFTVRLPIIEGIDTLELKEVED